MKKTNEIDMTEGPLFRKIVAFSLPLMLSGVLQLLFNAADTVVVGRWGTETALAAVGSTGSLINLIVNMLIGLSVGTSVSTAYFFGANREKDVSETIHTSVVISLLGGIIFGLIGVFFSNTFLGWMDTPENVIEQASLYMKIYFLGLPASMVYNFCAAILRAVGDTKRPLVYLTVAGIINVVLNFILVYFFNMDVAGVAIATVVSQLVSAVLVVRCLIFRDDCCKLVIRSMKIHKDKLLRILRIGIPAGLQGTVFSLSNVLIQSSVNSFGDVVMSANTAASNIEGFIYIAMNSLYHASLTFTGQNVGAKKYHRISKVFLSCMLYVIVIGLVLGNLAFLFGPELISIYKPNAPEVIEWGMKRLGIIAVTYFLCGMMEVFVGSLRGMGASMIPMIVSTLGACGIRILWIETIFAHIGTIESLYWSYPISWIITSVAHLICYLIIKRNLIKRNTQF
ncbi:MAG: MATE family efflux transporter [Clostridia bacterium]|nr:MATE family efflux transporter [Clostridia bacterium]